MKMRVLEFLRSPADGSKLHLADSGVERRGGQVYCGNLVDASGNTYPIQKYIPRLVSTKNYSYSWGKLWIETADALRDSQTGIPQHHNFLHGKFDSNAPLNNNLGLSIFGFEWPLDLSNEHVLEIGLGTGNMTEVLISTGARLTCVDMSHSVDSIPEEWLLHENIDVIQADIMDDVLDFEVDRILLFQVLQHTPSPPETLKRIAEFLRPGGEVAFTSYYGDGPWSDWYYPLTKRLPSRLAWLVIRTYIKPLTLLKFAIRKSGFPGHWYLKRLLDIADPRDIYWNVREGIDQHSLMAHSFQNKKEKELFYLLAINTFDRITPEYTNCATHEQARLWAESAGLTNIDVWGEGGVRVRAWRP